MITLNSNVELPTLNKDANGMPQENIQLNLCDPLNSTISKTLLFSDLSSDEQQTFMNYYNLMRKKLEEGKIIIIISQTETIINLSDSYKRINGKINDLSEDTILPLVFETSKNDFSGEKIIKTFNANISNAPTAEELTDLQEVGLELNPDSTWGNIILNKLPDKPVRLTVNLPDAIGNKSLIIE